MFSFGEQVYRLTGRDEETLLVDPAFRFATGVVPAAQVFQTFDMAVPIDRAYYLHSFQISLQGTALNTWTTANLKVFDRLGVTQLASLWEVVDLSAAGLRGDGGSAGSGVGGAVAFTVPLDLVLPPGCGIVRVLVARAGTTNNANAFINMNGYLIPPGRIGRI